MRIQTQDVDYSSGAATLRGYLAFDDSAAERRPGVLVFHEGLGLGDFARARARMLAELGYVALAADMFGGRRQARNLQEVAKFVGDLRSQPETLRARGLPRWRRLRRCRRSIRAGWRRSVSASAAPLCLSLRARAPTSKPSSAFTAFSRPGHPRLPAR